MQVKFGLSREMEVATSAKTTGVFELGGAPGTIKMNKQQTTNNTNNKQRQEGRKTDQQVHEQMLLQKQFEWI